jgi:hypothetical protein
MAADPAILQRIRARPFARGGRVPVRFRAEGYGLFARRSGEPLARLRPTGEGDDVALLHPSHRGGREPPGDFGALAMPLDPALERLSTNPYSLALRQTHSRAPPSPALNRNATPYKLQPRRRPAPSGACSAACSTRTAPPSPWTR